MEYMIKVNYEDMENGLVAVNVPDDVNLTYVLSEMTHLNHLLFALREIEYYETLDECIENNIVEENWTGGKCYRDYYRLKYTPREIEMFDEDTNSQFLIAAYALVRNWETVYKEYINTLYNRKKEEADEVLKHLQDFGA